ncbi:hypothetical protein [Streptomyces sp. NRRL B-24484]|uniref:hypothetical protein n=1 Tax=Streptomyces sp. NRRL B-24484 TaxID=1463833 RepID=UPI0004BEE709|nr:hypothetical protein [Streptomyces sp. NRRL B-24484]
MEEVVAALASWSPWVPVEQARLQAPRQPGVYMARSAVTRVVVYVGSAGPRASDRSGIRGRICKYTGGLASGLGEAALDRALADPEWLRVRLAEVEAGRAMRAAEWAKAALRRAEVELCWAVTSSKEEARALERRVQTAIGPQLWNRELP